MFEVTTSIAQRHAGCMYLLRRSQRASHNATQTLSCHSKRCTTPCRLHLHFRPEQALTQSLVNCLYIPGHSEHRTTPCRLYLLRREATTSATQRHVDCLNFKKFPFHLFLIFLKLRYNPQNPWKKGGVWTRKKRNRQKKASNGVRRKPSTPVCGVPERSSLTYYFVLIIRKTKISSWVGSTK